MNRRRALAAAVILAATRTAATSVSYSVRLTDGGGASLDGTYGCVVTATVGGTSATASACKGSSRRRRDGQGVARQRRPALPVADRHLTD